MSKKKPCVVTGGAGFIGSHVVEVLCREGYPVRIVDNFFAGRRQNLSGFKNIDIIRADIRNRKRLERVFRGVDTVFHLAAIRAVVRSVDDPLETDDVNVRGTLNVLLAAQKTKVRRVVFSSSCAVYGNATISSIPENAIPKPLSPYAASKVMGEYYCQIFNSLYSLETVVLRYFNVFGSRQNPESVYSAVIPIFIQNMTRRKPCEIHWDGKQSRDFVYVKDVARANLLAMHSSKAIGKILNIGSHKDHTILDIFNLLKKILDQPQARAKFLAKRPGDIRRSLANTKLAEKILGFKAKTGFEEGLEKTVEWFLNYRQ